MLASVIRQYLKEHKRIVVPQLGLFIVKAPGQVLFSELLKRDDGVLRGVLRGRGLAELEIAGEIDRFVFEVRHAVEHGAGYVAEGFGRFVPGPNGTIAFVYEPSEEAPEPDSMPAGGEGSDSGTAGRKFGEPDTISSEDSGSGAEEPQPDVVDRLEQVLSAQPEAEMEMSSAHAARSSKRALDPSVKGLRYGKPPKNTNAYTYVDRPPRRRGDLFIWLAIVVALIAVGAIAFGLWHDAEERRGEAVRIELPASPSPAADSADGPIVMP